MPTYTYLCNSCGEFDFFQSIHSDALTKCPTCSKKVKRLIGAVTFLLKGDNWPTKNTKNEDVLRIEKGMEKEDNELLRKGHTHYPAGHPQAGVLI